MGMIALEKCEQYEKKSAETAQFMILNTSVLS